MALLLKTAALMWLPGLMFAVAKARGIIMVVFTLVGSVLFHLGCSYEFLKENHKAYIGNTFESSRLTNPYDAGLFFFLSPEQ